MNTDVPGVLASQSAAWLACLLAVAALHKGYGWTAAVAATRALTGLSRRRAALALLLALLAESGAALLLGASLLDPAARLPGAVLAALLWAVYSACIVQAIRQDRRNIECGCSFGTGHAPLGRYQVSRNATLIGLAALTAAVPASRASASVGLLLLAAVSLTATYGALDQVMTLRPLRTGNAR